MGAPRAGLSARHRLARGSWVSLFAMLMIFIGPLISQAMPMNHHASMSMDMPAHHGESHHPQAPDDHHALWAKCGYCDLLFSCPALPGGMSWVALDTPPPTGAIIPAPRLGHARQNTFPGARSRAPPAAA
ncbi:MULTISPECIES: DUF2946 domain-containing protein [Pseudomonas]|uniref:DUF2946 domain-containing protein n=1 Tax=Pseudomonas poae TaxID=200451 RepID=A0AAP2RZE1_9PSED|nr:MULTISPECIES: DUF2946 domain-containing protein [Pseudomonas]ELQ14768.1 hypothetical protein A986_17303 [Pseudomonas fluorescens BRIP34879]KTC42793.1 hypothetical protein AO260_00335 [Pseudomonas sp. ABAC21]AGE28814.1 hypothetical protein H045_23780 [Pseudomonas poae RE*1-1-14]MCF5653940.1 DUF2946 domain-containing protein [Pseudomonas poae]MCF5780145.1 DUF2946 domain-containing protein [Pseudomonas poae]